MNTQTESRPTPEARGNQPQRRGYLYPQVNITETKDGYLLEAEMPGVNKDGLEVLLEGTELTIVGHRTSPVEGAQCVYRESAERDYRRTFELDPAINGKNIKARMDNGILFLELPKADEVKPRKIVVE